MSGNYELLFASAIGYGVAWRFQPGSADTFAFKPLDIKLTPGSFLESSK